MTANGTNFKMRLKQSMVKVILSYRRISFNAEGVKRRGLSMAEGIIIEPTRKHEEVLREQYLSMLSEIKKSPHKITRYKGLLEKILGVSEVEFVIDESEIGFVFNEKNLTNFGVVVSEVKKLNELESEEYEIELLILSAFAKLKIVKVKLCDLSSNRWLDKLGVDYIFKRGSAENLKDTIKRMARFAPMIEEFHYSGWALTKKNLYILNEKAMQGDFPFNEKHKTSCEHVLKMLDVAEHRLTIPILSIGVLSLVQSQMILTGEFFKGVICLLGQSQSFKTTLASLFFDFANGRKADVNFDSTENAITRIIGQKRDSVCIVDDLKPASTSGMKKTLTSKLEKIVRICADDSNGYQRAGRDNSTISSVSSGITVITAEEIPVNVYSTLARLLVLEINRKSVDVKKLTYFQGNHSIAKEFIEIYISYIAKQGVAAYCENLKKRFLDERNFFRSKLSDRNFLIDNRTNDMVSWLFVSFAEFLKYALKVNAIEKEDVENFTKEAEDVFENLMMEQADRIKELDDITRFFKALSILIDTREVHIQHLEARTKSYVSTDSKGAIGFAKKGSIFLKNDIAYQSVQSYYRRNGKEFAITEATLRKQLRDNGFIIASNAKSCIHRLYVNHETYQCIKFPDEIFFKLKEGNNDGIKKNAEISDNRSVRKNAENFLGR